MNEYQPIDCGDHDMLEIACMDHYQVDLALENETVTGVIERLETRDGQEFAWLRKSTGVEQEIRIDSIRAMTVLTRPARFATHSFVVPKK